MKRNFFMLLMKIKMAIFLTLMVVTGLNAEVWSQNRHLNVNFEKVSMVTLLDYLQKTTNLKFVYSNEDLETFTVSCEAKNASLEKILNDAFKDKPLKYELVDNHVVVSRVKNFPQNKQVVLSGVVKDENGAPIPGATVIIKGTTFGTSTNENGRFELSVSENAGLSLVFSFIGMKTKDVLVGSTRVFNITLQQEVAEIDEVVVTGIFNKPRESYTGAVTTITSEQLKMNRGQNVLQTLRNIDPTLNIAVDNVVGSDPNKLPNVTIRGNSSLPLSVEELNANAGAQLNTPLIIMDGYEISLQKLMDYNDEEISSINIMKDAAATAIYGSRGANGVIVVTTRAPKPGKLQVYAMASLNLEMPDLSSYNLMNAKEKLEVERLAGIYEDKTNTVKDFENKAKYNALLEEVIRGVDTYWLGEPVRTGVGQRYNVRLDGGSNEFRWSASVDYNDIAGAMKDSDRKNLNASITLSYSYKNLIFKNQASYYTNKAHNSKYGSFASYAKMNPYWRIYDENGNIIKSYKHVLSSTYGGTITNPLYNSTLNTYDENKTSELTDNLSVEWNSKFGLRLNGRFSINKNNSTTDIFKPASHTDFTNYTSESSIFRKGRYTYGTGDGLNYDFSLTASYSKTFAEKHQLYVGVDYSVRQSKSSSYRFIVEGFPNENMDFLPNGLQYMEGSKASGDESLTRSIGVTANTNYTYDNRYYADFSFRADGASQFGSNNKFAPFWSVGIGWNVHREAFMKDQSLINSLRIRMSLGQNGSQQFGAYQALSTLKYYTDKNYLIWNGAQLMGIGNKDLKWQKTNNYNAGFDLVLLNNSLNVGFDVYKKKTSNLLSNMELPDANGFNSYVDNVGEIENNGFEATLGGYVLRNTSKDFYWNVTAKVAYNKNKIVKLSEAIKRQTENAMKNGIENYSLLFEGRSTSAIYAVRSLGIDPSTGLELFYDDEGNITNTWSSAYKVYAGDSQLKYNGNINSVVSWKGLSLSLNFGFHWGGQQYNSTLMDKVEVSTYGIISNVDKRVLNDRWINVGDVKQFKGFSNNATKMSTRFVMDDKVFNLQSANLTYRWHSDYLKSTMNIETINFGLTMSDVFYVSSIKRERGTSYPFARRVGFNVSVLF